MKHFALNNNKINRHTSNPIVDDRTLYEIYLPGFKAAAVEGKAWYFMGGYNLGTVVKRIKLYNELIANAI